MILPILKEETPIRHSIYWKDSFFAILIMSFIYLNVSNVNITFLCSSTKTKFRYWLNNYKSTRRKFRKKYVDKHLAIVIKKSELKQKLFHKHYCSEGHQGIKTWSVTLIGQVEDLNSRRKKELHWINKLNSWAPNDLNVREVYEAYHLVKKEKIFFRKG